jgi:hypothetical protein
MNAHVQKHPIYYNNLIGIFYSTQGSKKKPGILLLSGSESGIPSNNAILEFFIEYLAKNEFAILALSYFGMENLPTNLENIPLEYVS